MVNLIREVAVGCLVILREKDMAMKMRRSEWMVVTEMVDESLMAGFVYT